MWVVHNVANDFPDIPVASLSLFRVILGVAVLWKVGWEHRWGGYHYFDRTALTRWRYERIKRHVKLVPSPAAYHVLYLARMVAAACFFAGALAPIAATYLAVWFAFEFTFDRKFHTQFLCLMCAVMAFSSRYGACLGYRSVLAGGTLTDARYCSPAAAQTSSVPVIIGMLVVVQMYWSSVRHKIVSPQFLSGDVLQKTNEHYFAIRTEMPFPEWHLPPRYYRLFATGSPESVRRRWRPFALATLIVEASLPILLLVPGAFWIGFGVGAVMHAAMAGLFPKRLMPYSVAAVGAYLLFLDPVTVARWLT